MHIWLIKYHCQWCEKEVPGWHSQKRQSQKIYHWWWCLALRVEWQSVRARDFGGGVFLIAVYFIYYVNKTLNEKEVSHLLHCNQVLARSFAVHRIRGLGFSMYLFSYLIYENLILDIFQKIPHDCKISCRLDSYRLFPRPPLPSPRRLPPKKKKKNSRLFCIFPGISLVNF